MKIKTVALLALVHKCAAFAPTAFTGRSNANAFKQSAMVDPSMFHDLPHHIDTLSNVFSSINLADADLLSTAADSAQTAVAPVTEAVTEAAAPDNGWFGFLAGPIEFLLELLHGIFAGVGMDSNTWGLAIISMTTIIKLVTYPLTAQQLESTSKMQVSTKLQTKAQRRNFISCAAVKSIFHACCIQFNHGS